MALPNGETARQLGGLFAEVGRRLIREGGPIGMGVAAVVSRQAVAAAAELEQAPAFGRCLGLTDDQIREVLAEETTRPAGGGDGLGEALLRRAMAESRQEYYDHG